MPLISPLMPVPQARGKLEKANLTGQGKSGKLKSDVKKLEKMKIPDKRNIIYLSVFLCLLITVFRHTAASSNVSFNYHLISLFVPFFCS